MSGSYLGVSCLMLPCIGSMAFAAPPQYTVIDLGNEEAGQGPVWQELVAAQGSFPGLGGINFVYASNSAADVGASNIPNQASHAARWVPVPGGATFTDLGLLPNAF